MAVIVKTECQKCEMINELQLDGVMVLGYEKREGKTEVIWWNHDITPREIILAILDWFAEEMRELGEDFNMSPWAFLLYLIANTELKPKE